MDVEIDGNLNDMHDKIIIEETDVSPKVTIDPENGLYEIVGWAMPEDAYTFFHPIFFRLRKLLLNKENKVTLNIKLEYFNTSTAKMFLDFFEEIENDIDSASNFNINWHYKKEDLEMLQQGKDFAEFTTIPFTMIPYL